MNFTRWSEKSAKPSCVCQSSKSGTKFLSKIKLKLEGNFTQKLSGKLCRYSKHLYYSNDLPIDDERGLGKYTPHKNLRKEGENSKPNKNIAIVDESSNIDMIINISKGKEQEFLLDDDDSDFELSITNQSLEDEIFQELEKVTLQDNFKRALQNFDKIIIDYRNHSSDTGPKKDMTKNDEMSYENILFPFHNYEKDPFIFENIQGNPFQAPDMKNFEEKTEKAPPNNKLLLRNGRCFSSIDFIESSANPMPKFTSLRIKASASLESYLNHASINYTLPTYTSKTRKNALLSQNIFKIDSHERMLNCGEKEKLAPTLYILEQEANIKTVKNIEPFDISSSRAEFSKRLLSLKTLTKNSDALLTRCLSVGRDILNKVESLNYSNHKNNCIFSSTTKICNPSTTLYTFNTNSSFSCNNISKDYVFTLTNHKKKIYYANIEKLKKIKLESCKVIHPKFGEESVEHINLLIPVKEVIVKQSFKQNAVCDILHKEVTKVLENSDKSEHVSNKKAKGCATLSIPSQVHRLSMDTLNEQSTTHQNVSKLCKTFEKKASIIDSMTIKNNNCNFNSIILNIKNNAQKSVLTTKIAIIEPFHYSKTNVEIFKNFRKEVTISYY